MLSLKLTYNKYKPNFFSKIFLTKANNKIKFINISIGSDKILQKAIYIFLKPVFNFLVIKNFYNFQQNKNCHICLSQIYYNWLNIKWFIKIDFLNYFDQLSYSILLNIISKKFYSYKLLQIINLFFHYGYINFNHYDNATLNSVKHENKQNNSLLNLFFCNLLLYELDFFLLKFSSKLFYKLSTIFFINWYYQKQFLLKNWCKNIWFFITFNIKNKIFKQKIIKFKCLKKFLLQSIVYKEFQNYVKIYSSRKFYYTRYTKNLLCGLLGFKIEFILILTIISHYVELFLKIKFNVYNTKFSHITKGIFFLGYKIWKRYNLNFKWKVQSLRIKQRQKLLRFNFDVPLYKLFEYFTQNGFFMKSKKKFTNKFVGKRQEKWVFLLNDAEILSRYNNLLKKITFYYSGSTQQEVLNKLYFSLKKSALLTIANRNCKKYASWTLNKYGKNIKISINYNQKKKYIKFFKPKILKIKWYKSIKGNLTNLLTMSNIISKSKNSSILQTVEEISCSVTNCPNKATEWYFVKHSKVNRKLSKKLETYISKKISVCNKHYLLIRSGKYDGPSLKKLKGYIFQNFD